MSIVLNGSSQYAWRNAPVASAAPFTVSAWVKSTSDAALQAVWSESRESVKDSFWRLALWGSGAGDPVLGYVRGPGGTSSFQTSTGYATGVWHHVLLLETSSTNHKVYLDGGNQGSDTTSAVPSYTDTMAVGAMAYNDSWVNFFAGKIGAVAVWNIALSSADQASLAAGADPATIQPSNLVGCWPLVSDAKDVSGNGCHLTVAGSATFDADDHPDIGDSYVDMSVTSGGTGGGVSSLRSGQLIDVSVTAGGTGGGSIMLLGSSAWAGQHDTKQYVVAIGNGQVWICEV